MRKPDHSTNKTGIRKKGGSTWMCENCMEPHTPNKKSPKKDVSVKKTLENNDTLKEITLLKLILAEKDEKYALLYENKKLLDEKIHNLQNEIKMLKKSKQHQEKIIKTSISIPSADTIPSPTMASTQESSTTLTSEMHPIINNEVKHDNKKVESSDNKPTEDETEFRLVKKKKRTKNKLYFGEAECSESTNSESSFFQGREKTEKMAWLFISRIKDNATNELISDYIRRKTNNVQNIIVSEIVISNPRQDNKCFKVGVSYEHKNQLYDQKFWPVGVAFRRYTFENNKKSTSGNFLGLSRPQKG